MNVLPLLIDPVFAFQTIKKKKKKRFMWVSKNNYIWSTFLFLVPTWFWWDWGRSWPGNQRCSSRSYPGLCPLFSPAAVVGAAHQHPRDRWASWSASYCCCTRRKATGSSLSTRGSRKCCWVQGRLRGRATRTYRYYKPFWKNTTERRVEETLHCFQYSNMQINNTSHNGISNWDWDFFSS